MFSLKQAFLGQFGFQLFERELQRACATRFHIFYNDLIGSSWLVNADAPQADNRFAVGRIEFQMAPLSAKHYGGNACFIVVQTEISMT